MDNLVSERFIALSQVIGIEVSHINDLAEDNNLQDENNDRFIIGHTEFDEETNGIYYVMIREEIVDRGEDDIDNLWELALQEVDEHYHFCMDYIKFWNHLESWKDTFDRGFEEIGKPIDNVKIFDTTYYIFKE